LAAKTFRCRLVTPTASLVDDAVVYASVPAWDGLFGVLPGRAPILARLGVGELRIDFPDVKGGGGSRSFLIEGGFVRMVRNELTILAERATAAETITEADAQAELRQIEERIKGIPATDPERSAKVAGLTAAKRAAEVKLRLVRSGRGI
jgi:F-type H+-transporting ATPase subunit epsilon